jgi:hypothetical protein
MPSIGSSLGITLPTPGTTTDWGDDLNTAIQTIIDAIEAGVPSGGLNIAANIDLNTYGLLETGFAQLTNQGATLTASTDYNKVYAYGGNLYFTDGSGAAIQITKNSALNSALTGAITGSGYGSGGVAVNWDSVGSEFEFTDGTGADDFANIRVDKVRLHDGSSHYLALGVTSLSANATLTFPALPASTLIAQCDSSGNISYSNTISQAVDFSSTVTCAAHPKFTADLKIPLAAAAFQGYTVASEDWEFTYTNYSTSWQCNTTAGELIAASIPVPEGMRIVQVDVILKTSSTGFLPTVRVWRTNGTTDSQLDSDAAAASTSVQTVTCSTGFPLTVAAGYLYSIVVTGPTSGAGTVDVYGAVVHYDYV